MPISAQELRECINKLKDGKDITKKEAVSIRARYTVTAYNMNKYGLYSSYEDRDSYSSLSNSNKLPKLYEAYMDWFKMVHKRLPEFGNYVQTIPVKRSIFVSFNCDFAKIIQDCMNKITELDKANEIEFLSIPKGWDDCKTLYPKWVGDVRFTKVYEKIKRMVPLFEGMSYFDFLTKSFRSNWLHQYYYSPSDLNPNEKACLSLYVPTVISVAGKMDIPVLNVEVDTTNPHISQGSRYQIVMVNPEDREKLKSVLSVSPEEFFQKVTQTGLYKAAYEAAMGREISLYDRLGDSLIRYYFTKKKYEIIENDEWMETER
mgnify:CR=1 FL=1